MDLQPADTAFPTCQELIQRHGLDVLSDTTTRNRGDKKKALESLRKECSAQQLAIWDDQGVSTILNDLFDRMSIWAISDIENIREQTATLYQQIVHHATLSPATMDRMLSLVHQRLGHQQRTTATAAFSEPTEEIRLIWADIMLAIVSGQSPMSAIQVQSALDNLQLTIRDPSPEVQKKGGNALTELAKNYRKEVALAGERPMHMILDLLYHKHSAIRVIGLQAAEKAGLAFPGGISLLFKTDEAAKRQAVFPLLVYDNALMVRITLPQVAGSLLVDVPPQQRYANFSMLFPILLSCASDDMESISSSGNAQIVRVALACASDLDAAGILEIDATHDDDDRRFNAGFEHAVHQCYKPLLRQSIDEAMQLEEHRRLRALDVLATLYKYAIEEDLWRAHQRTLDDLFTIYCNGANEQAVVDKMQTVLSVLGKRLPDDVYIYALVPRLEEDELLHAETMCMGTKGVSIVVDMLRGLFLGSSVDKVSDIGLEKLTTTLDKSYFWSLLTEDEELVCKTAKLVQELVDRHLKHRPPTDTMRERLVWFGTVLRAASRIYRRNRATASSAPSDGQHGCECNIVTDMVNQIIVTVAQPLSDSQDEDEYNTVAAIVDRAIVDFTEPTVASVYGHYLPTLLTRLCQYPKRSSMRPDCWTPSSVELHVLQILVESITGDALADAVVTEQLVELLCLAGSQPSKENKQLGSIGVRTSALQLLAILYCKDDAAQYLHSYEHELFDKLLMPGLQSAGLTGGDAGTYHVGLLHAIAIGIKNEAISIYYLNERFIPSFDNFLSSTNEGVITAAIELQLCAAGRLLRNEQYDAAKALLRALLAHLQEAEDETAQRRRRVLIQALATQPSIDIVRQMDSFGIVESHVRPLLESSSRNDPEYPNLCRLAEMYGMTH